MTHAARAGAGRHRNPAKNFCILCTEYGSTVYTLRREKIRTTLSSNGGVRLVGEWLTVPIKFSRPLWVGQVDAILFGFCLFVYLPAPRCRIPGSADD